MKGNRTPHLAPNHEPNGGLGRPRKLARTLLAERRQAGLPQQTPGVTVHTVAIST